MAARDVQFIIRARDEASAAFEKLNSALEQMSGWNGKAGASSNILSSDLGRLVQALGSVDQVARAVNGASDRAGSSFDAQRAKVRALEGDLANLKAQAAAASNAMSNVKAAGAATGNTAESEAQVTAIAAAQKQLNSAIDQTSVKLGKAQADLAALGTEYQRAASLANALDAAQPGLKSGQEAAAAAVALEEQAQWAAQLRAQLNPLAGIQEHYRVEIEKANAALKAGLITEKEHLAAVKLLQNEQKGAMGTQGIGPDGRPTLFGMKPWQATNLMYQVNDVVSGLAMGQKPSQIIAQQLGQVIQLFPKLGSGIMAAFSNPVFLGAAATLGAIGFAAKQAADQAERLRAFAGILAENADGARYSAQALNENVKALQAYHLSADEAVTISKTFIKEGLDPSYFERFGQAAKDMSRVMGVDVKDAASQLTEAFTGGYTAVAKLDDATHFLTVSERDHIRSLFESGQAAEARRVAFEKFAEAQRTGAEKTKSAWTKAFDELGTGWARLKQNLGDSSWANAINSFFEHGLENFTNRIKQLADLIDRVNEADRQYALTHRDNGTVGSVTVALPAATKATPEQEARARAAANGGTDPKAGTSSEESRLQDLREINRLETQLADARTSSARIALTYEVTLRKALLDGKSNAEAALAAEKARADVIREIERGATQLFMQNVRGAEGTGKNQMGSKAAGIGQFMPGTWEAMFKRVFPAQAKSLSSEQIQNLRYDNKYASAILEAWSRDLVKFLHGTVGQVASATNLYIAHVLGTGATGRKFFRSSDDADLQSIVGATAMRQNRWSKGMTVGGLKSWAANRIGDTTNDTFSAERNAADQLAQAQEALNKKIDEGNADRAASTKYLRDQVGLSAQALYNAQRQQTIDEAVRSAQRDADNSGAILSPDQVQSIKDSTAAQYDAAHAEELLNAQLSEQQTLRQALMTAIQNASARGDSDAVTALTAELNGMQPALLAAIDKLEAFWNAAPEGAKKSAMLESFRQLRQEIGDTAAALKNLDLQRLQKQTGGLEKLRGDAENQIGMSQLLGDRDGARQAQSALESIDAELVKVRESQIAIYQDALQNHPEWIEQWQMTREEIAANIVELQQANQQTDLLGRQFLMTGRQINETLADTATNAIDQFFQKVGQGQNVFRALWTSAVQGVSDFLRQIGLAILKQALFNAIAGKSKGGAGGLGGSLAGSIGSLFSTAVPLTTAGATLTTAGGVLQGAAQTGIYFAGSLMAAAQTLMVANSIGKAGAFHTGGIVGSPSMFRTVSPAVFAGAMRYHSGGLAGLQPDEVPAILKRGEEVLTQGDSRHRKNGGRGVSGGTEQRGLRQVLAIGDDEIAKAMAGTAGEDVFLTFIRRNRTTIRQEIGA